MKATPALNEELIRLNQRHFNVRLHCSALCNLSCDYCHVFKGNHFLPDTCKEKRMSFETAKTILDSYRRLLHKEDDVHIRIAFYGGEPLLNWKMVRKTLAYGNQIFDENVTVEWIINTNGTLLSEAKARILKYEGVDIHVSTDGRHPENNVHRKSKRGKEVFDNIAAGIQTASKEGCRLQFDSCLSAANVEQLEDLIDYAQENNVYRIYLALTDLTSSNQAQPLQIPYIAKKMTEAMSYAQEVGVHLTGPWRKAILDSEQDNKADHVPYLVFSPDGSVHLSPYVTEAIGKSDDLVGALNSSKCEEMSMKYRHDFKDCKECNLYFSCRGYLKNMVKYHTGSFQPADSECSMALELLDKLPLAFGGDLPFSRGQKLKLSSHLSIRKDESGAIIYHGHKDGSLELTPDLEEFLTLFRDPITPASVLEEFDVPNLWSLTAKALELNLLIAEARDEELEWLHKNHEVANKRKLENQQFICFHDPDNEPFAHDFLDMLNESAKRLFQMLPEAYRMGKKPIVYLCKNQQTFKEFWHGPGSFDWMAGFVTFKRILVVKVEAYSASSLKTEKCVRGMMHELVHIYLKKKHYRLPVWFEEGLCETLSKPMNESFQELAEKRKIYGLLEYEHLVSNNLLDLDGSPVNENICYKQVHSFVHFLVARHGIEPLLACFESTGMLGNYRDRFQKSFGYSLSKAEKEWLTATLPAHQGYTIHRKLVLSKNLRNIQHDDQLLVYNSFYGDSLICNQDILFLLDELKESKTLDELSQIFELDDIIESVASLFSKKLLVFDHEEELNEPFGRSDIEKIKNGHQISSLRLNVSHDCNLACTYCYIPEKKADNQKMSWSVAQQSLTTYFDILKSGNQTGANIRFFGGEPLLNWSVIQNTFEFVQTEYSNFKVRYILNTNSTLINEEMARVLKERNVSIAISLDGMEEIHDRNRRFRTGTGSFAKVDSGIDLLLAAGCKIGIEITLGENNIHHLSELVRHLAEKQKRFHNRFSLGFQCLCVTHSASQYVDMIVENLPNIRNAINLAKQLGMNSEAGMLHFPVSSLKKDRGLGRYCNGTGGEITVLPNGDIWPCSAIEQKMGTIGQIQDVFKSEEYLQLVNRVSGNIPECRGCDIESFCAGGCTADAVAAKGGLLFATANCRIEQEFFKNEVMELLR